MSDLNPTEIYRRYQRKELDKALAVGYLKSFIENSSDEDLRAQAVELLGEMDLDVSDVFEFFEQLVTSDESNPVRLESLKIIVLDFLDEGISAIHYVIKHERSADNLLFLYRTLEEINSEESNRMLNEMEFILGKEYSIKFKIDPKEAMALQLISMLTGIKAIHSHYWRDASCVAIRPKKGKINSLVIHDVKYSEIKFIDFFPDLEYLTISSTDLTEIKNLESVSNLKYLDLNYNKITTIKGLNKLVNLEELDLSYNPIANIEGLKHLGKLRSVNFEECKLEYSKIEQYFQKLNKKNIKIY
jgi:Leucine-rich repeat (LRR) protein